MGFYSEIRKNQTSTLYITERPDVFPSKIMFSGGIQLPHNFFTTLHYFPIGGFPGHHEKLI